MKLLGLLSWYDEAPGFLASCITALAKAGVDHLVAVDGAYYLLPNAKARSPREQHDIIEETCYGAGLGLTLHVPDEPWEGNEVEKRSHLFALAETISTEDDWYMVMDADQVVTHCAIDLKAKLAELDEDAAEVRFTEPQAPIVQAAVREYGNDDTSRFPVRILFRALPGIHVVNNHYTYVTGDGRKLWGHAVKTLVDCADLSEVVEVEHRTHHRDAKRHQQQHAYYHRRSETGIEIGACDRCGAEGGRMVMPTGFTYVGAQDNGEAGLEAEWTAVCADCSPIVGDENVKVLTEYGVDPSFLTPYKQVAH